MPNAHSAGSNPPVVVIAPDSFKGSLSAEQVAEAISNGIRRARADHRPRFAKGRGIQPQ